MPWVLLGLSMVVTGVEVPFAGWCRGSASVALGQSTDDLCFIRFGLMRLLWALLVFICGCCVGWCDFLFGVMWGNSEFGWIVGLR